MSDPLERIAIALERIADDLQVLSHPAFVIKAAPELHESRLPHLEEAGFLRTVIAPFLDWGGRTQPLPDLHPKE